MTDHRVTDVTERLHGMRRYLLVALWPAGLAAIAAATVIAARRAPGSPPPPPAPAPAAGDPADQASPGPAAGDPADQASPGSASEAVGVAGTPGRICGLAAARPDWLPDLIRLGAIGGAGGIVSYGVMALLGPPVVNHGLAIDEPIFRWTDNHQVDWWAAVMWRFNKIGDVWTTWGAAAAAAACLGVSWRQQRWLPPAALGTAIVVDHCATSALQQKFNRLGPPTNPLGTYPSGGTDRVVLFHGLIAHLLWREFSGSRQAKIWATGAVAALAFSQAYCRQYLSQHWFIDIISGLGYGVMLLAPFIAAIRLIAGPAGLEAERRAAALAAAPA
jgi:PAP2 superfamily